MHVMRESWTDARLDVIALSAAYIAGFAAIVTQL
jgi:hypothetical protein